MRKIFLISLMLSFRVFADELLSKDEQVTQVLAKNTYEPNYFSMILGLFVVILLIYLTGYLYQRLTKVNLKHEQLFINKPQVISTTTIGQGRNLHVVKIGDSACLIGSTQNQITFLKDVELQQIVKEGEENG